MAYRNSNEQTLKQVLEQLFKTYRIDHKVNEQLLIAKYKEMVGPMIAKYTQSARIRNRILFLEITSSVVKNELSYAKTKLVDNLNREVGKKVIDKIVIK